jgi:SH3-like domain-containing protein
LLKADLDQGRIEMRYAILMTLSTLALAGAVPAEAQPRGPTCNISAYYLNGARLSVRAGPSANARALRTRAYQGSPVAEITGQRGGWFRVSRITDYEDDTVLFQGNGWVPIASLGTSIANADPRLYARPSRQSRRLARLVPDGSLVTLLGCTGTWAQVRFRRQVGWLSSGGQCSNPLTTCP